MTALTIKNFALIEDIELSLQQGFSVITGETGAGKSILLGALALILGKRADLNNIKDPKKKCVIEGSFSIANYALENFFEENDLDYESQTIIRREILPSGKSRAFINDTPTKLKVLSILGGHLVDIHSQHETLFIGDSNYQYRVLDDLAHNRNLLKQFQSQLQKYHQLQKELKALLQKQQETQKSYDYHLFLLQELEALPLETGMQTELEERQQELANVEELKEHLSFAIERLQKEDFGVTDSLQEIRGKFARLENFGERYRHIYSRLENLLLELEDITSAIESLSENIEADPEGLEEVNEQLQNLYQLQKKHGVDTVKELIDIQEDLRKKIDISERAGADTKALEKAIATARNETEKIAKTLWNRRKDTLPKFIQFVEQSLKSLGMPHARLSIELNLEKELNTLGADKMEWLFSANKGGRLLPLKKAASGGELSRIALVIKSIQAEYSHLPTLIFDEIDTGVSGEIAKKMGDIMKTMGKQLQVISITHLPQIAGKGDHHFKVYKKVIQNSTRTLIKNLNPKERITELAEMLGGKEKSASALAHAKSLLN